MSTILPSLLLLFLFGIFAASITTSVLAFTTTPKADLFRIKVSCEGISGPLGVYKKVVNVRRVGGRISTRGSLAARKYLVTLERLDGAHENREIWINVALLGEGEMTVEDRASG